MLRILLSQMARKDDTPLRCEIVMNKGEGRVNVVGSKGMRDKEKGNEKGTLKGGVSESGHNRRRRICWGNVGRTKEWRK